MWPSTQSLKRPEKVCRDWGTLGSLPGLEFSAGSLHLAAAPTGINGNKLEKLGLCNTLPCIESTVSWDVKWIKVVWETEELKLRLRQGKTRYQALERVMSEAARVRLTVSSEQSSLPGSWELHWPRIHCPLKIGNCQFTWWSTWIFHMAKSACEPAHKDKWHKYRLWILKR